MSISNDVATLPIGSVVMIGGMQRLVCVIGKDVKNHSTGDSFEYAGVFYPQGFTQPDQCCMFHEKNIAAVYAFGLLDDLKDRNPGTANADSVEGILPVGSVVRLKGSRLYFMIAGIGMEETGKGTHLYDYGAVLFPYGLEGTDSLYLFDKEQIEEILHVGFIYDEQIDYEEKVEKILFNK